MSVFCVYLMHTWVCLSVSLCFSEQSYGVRTIKQIQQEVTVKDGPREAKRREKCQINSLTITSCLSVYWWLTLNVSFLCFLLLFNVCVSKLKFVWVTYVYLYVLCIATYLWLTWVGLSATAGSSYIFESVCLVFVSLLHILGLPDLYLIHWQCFTHCFYFGGLPRCNNWRQW